jgi:hypothetical protein
LSTLMSFWNSWNDLSKQNISIFWVENDVCSLRQKKNGRSFHVSRFDSTAYWKGIGQILVCFKYFRSNNQHIINTNTTLYNIKIKSRIVRQCPCKLTLQFLVLGGSSYSWHSWCNTCKHGNVKERCIPGHWCKTKFSSSIGFSKTRRRSSQFDAEIAF